ncbi:MAG TPA: hypothetical protein DCG39_03825 [Opitutae bacterium]|nr:hypothetical protein [Opitutae bacterium]
MASASSSSPGLRASSTGGISRNRYLDLALPYVPRILHLLDQNPYSPSYGSFDRSFWHYRTMDFPCGMSQEMVLLLALVYKNEFENNPFHGLARIRELSEAAIRFMLKSSHPDGTCDDYFPFERAMGALVFSLYASTESYLTLGMKDDEIASFFLRRVRHLERENETGRLGNHQALAALAAYNTYLITGDERAREVADQRQALTLSWQHPEEGWIQEYEGADPGYHTCSIDFLAKLRRKMLDHGESDDALLEGLLKAVDFSWNFIHPDGSYGGEYGSRNTFHFYPHGFELLAPLSEKAGQIADAFLEGSGKGKRYHNDDDRMTAHYAYNFLQAWEDRIPQRPPPLSESRRKGETIWLRDSGLIVSRNGREWEEKGGIHLVCNLHKGGVLKAFDARGPIASDTGLIGELKDGTVIVSHLVQEDNLITREMEGEDELRWVVDGVMCKRRSNQMSVLKNLLLRVWCFLIGRFNANLTRSLVQKIAITGKPKTRYRFQREIEILPDRIRVTDRLDPDIPFKRLSIGSDATSIYVANSLTYQESRLCPWQHADWKNLPVENGKKTWTREYFRGSGHSPYDS